MATIRGIELASDIYDLEDTQGRTATQTAQGTATNALDKADSNETAIEAIEAVIPATASSSNPLATVNDLPEISTSVTENDTNPVSGAAVFNAISVKKVAQTDIVQSSMSFDISALPSGVYAIVAGNCYYQACSASYVYLFGLDRGNNVVYTPCKIVNSFDGVSDPTVTSNSVTIPQLGVFSKAYLLKIA